MSPYEYFQKVNSALPTKTFRVPATTERAVNTGRDNSYEYAGSQFRSLSQSSAPVDACDLLLVRC